MQAVVQTPLPGTSDWGIDTHDFWGLAARLVPCGPAHILFAVDLKRRLWWWSVEDRQWISAPENQLQRLFAEINAWRSIVPDAVDALTGFRARGLGQAASNWDFTRFTTIQDTLMRMHEFYCAWQAGWLYRSLLLDHRWLLCGFDLPGFDEYVFSTILGVSWGNTPTEHTIRHLQQDPVITAMPALYDMVFPESWKTGCILALKERRIFVDVTDVDQAIQRLCDGGRLNQNQMTDLQAHHGPLIGDAGSKTKADVVADLVSARLDSPERRLYVHFVLPTADRVLQVAKL
jgi:hypothetical protein